LGADVVGIDISGKLIAAGEKRANHEGLQSLVFQQGDACNLAGVDDQSFDLTLSIFGAMFAPRSFDVAKEMIRVTKPGGRIVMGNWIPNDPSFVSQMLKISSSFTPPSPEGFVSPMTWGEEAHVVERFGHAGVKRTNISMTKETYFFVSPYESPESFVDSLLRFYGPTMTAFEAAQRAGRPGELQDQLLKLAMSQNKSKNGGTFIPATFLRVTVNV
jgi:SAM-dependent methyltransferase